MNELSPQTLTMAIQAIDAEMRGITDSVRGDVTKLEADAQEVLMSYSKAAMELKAHYLEVCKSVPGLPPYEELLGNN